MTHFIINTKEIWNYDKFKVLKVITTDENVKKNMQKNYGVTTPNFLKRLIIILICKLYCFVMVNVTASVVNVAKNTL